MIRLIFILLLLSAALSGCSPIESGWFGSNISAEDGFALETR